MIENFKSYLLNVEGKPYTTVKMYAYDIQSLLRYFTDHKIRVKKATKNDLYNYMTFLAQKGIKPVTRSRQCSAIKKFYAYLGLKNADFLHKPKIDKREVTCLTLSESVRLIYMAKKRKERNHLRNVCTIVLFLNLGLRLSELISINIEDIDFENQKIRIKGKGGKERTLYLNKNCISAINDYRKDRTCGALFLSEQKSRVSRRTVQYIVQNQIRNAGLTGTPHKLRHTCATNMYQTGTDIRLLQKILGHENISTTEIYVHVKDEQMKKAIDRMGGIYEKL